jgi:serine-type D-Ala-D-Ala carboxypeptidase/endopeptidase (penicillin-binding protein 4)
VPLLRRLVPTLGVAVALAVAAPGGAQPPLETRLARALVVPHVSLARSSAVVLDLATGQTVFVQNENAALAPASNEKLAVTFAALSELGPTFRLETHVLGDGLQDGAVWRGDLVLKGYGDPTLSSADLRGLARQLREAGIRRVTGAIVGDESRFDERRTAAGWKPSFYLEESPPLSALVVDRARSGRFVSSDPALAAALRFRTILRAAGIGVAGPARVGLAGDAPTLLAVDQSPPLQTIVRQMNLESDNFTAELLLKELGAVDSDLGTSASGAAVVTRLLLAARVPLAGVRIVDGSGLSLLDRLTANALARLLQVMWLDPTVRPALVRSLPVAGISGTLEKRMRRGAARGVVLAKTGTTSVASALSGFVGDRYVFAVVQNGYPLPFWWARAAQDRFAAVLAAWIATGNRVDRSFLTHERQSRSR